MRAFGFIYLFLPLGSAWVLAACGSDDSSPGQVANDASLPDGTSDVSADPQDGSVDVLIEASLDAALDSPHDTALDSPHDTALDNAEPDAPLEASPDTSTGNVLTAPSCAQQDVQTAIGQAVAGDTVRIPAGTCTWGADGSFVSVDRPITLEGDGPGITVIEIASTAAAWTSGTIRLSAAATVGDLTIQTGTSSNSGTAFSASANGFRITNVEYLGKTTSVNGYFLYADTYGLVDSCNITGGAGNNELIFARGTTDSWQTPSTMGGADNLFIEDSTFGGQGYVTDCNSNSRCVVRYNTITAAMKVDGHGKASNTPPRGVRHMELYHNTWTNDSSYWAAMELRGGTGRVFANRATSPGIWFILHEYAATAAWPNFDNVILTAADYPVDDQIGVGADPKAGGSEPMYLFGNQVGDTPWGISLGYGNEEQLKDIIVADRDYFAETTPFDGSSGVGTGAAAEMAAITPTTAGVGFWVTDEGDWNSQTPEPDGVLYVWDGSAWVARYQPYPYPHPLRQ